MRAARPLLVILTALFALAACSGRPAPTGEGETGEGEGEGAAAQGEGEGERASTTFVAADAEVRVFSNGAMIGDFVQHMPEVQQLWTAATVSVVGGVVSASALGQLGPDPAADTCL